MRVKTIAITVVIVLLGTFVNASTQKLNEKESEKIESQKPRITIDQNNRIAVTYVDTIKKARSKRVVRIFDKSGSLVNYYHLNKKGNVRIKYDISGFPDGDYSFKIYEKNKLICSKEISKQISIQTNVYEKNLALNDK